MRFAAIPSDGEFRAMMSASHNNCAKWAPTRNEQQFLPFYASAEAAEKPPVRIQAFLR